MYFKSVFILQLEFWEIKSMGGHPTSAKGSGLSTVKSAV